MTTNATTPVGARETIAEALKAETAFDEVYCETLTDAILASLRANGLVIVPQEAVDQPFQIGDEVFRPMGMGDWEDGIVTDVRHHWEVRVKYETLREGWINANEIHKPNRAALKEQGHG